MARGVNKVILIGNLGADPETRYMPNGDAVSTFNLATSETWRDKASGEPQERTEWHRVVFFGRTAEVAKEYLRKGSKVYVEGGLRTRKWQGSDGVDRYTTEVVGRDLQMLDSRPAGSSGHSGSPPPAANSGAAAPTAPGESSHHYSGSSPAPPTPGESRSSTSDRSAPMDEGFDDEIPF